MSKTLVVIGGGAAGFFCAVNAARSAPGLRVIILEKQGKVLQKVKVSGGGRCNLTHDCRMNSELLQAYPRGRNFLKKAFRHFSTDDTKQWFTSRGVALKTEADGRVFPASDQSQSIIDCLLKEAGDLGVQVKLHAEVSDVKRTGTKFTLRVSKQDDLDADYLFVAPGGFSKEEHYTWIRQLGHGIVPPIPSLFTFNAPKAGIRELMGLSVPNAIVKIEGQKLQEQGPVLITHWGLSGPAVLRLSAFGARILHELSYTFTVLVNWLGIPENELREQWTGIRNRLGATTINTRNPFGLAGRLWDFFVKEAEIPENRKWSELSAKEQNRLMHLLTTYALPVDGKTTFKEEFVTCGGVDLSGIDAERMESKLIPNLYFGGEIMDVDGITGGYNFQHAWSSGYIAGMDIAGKCG